jgi:recA bacterial DNA recombination protein
MRHLSIVKSLSHLKQEQKYSNEVLLDAVGLTLTRGTLSEFMGSASTGRTSLALNLLAKLTSLGEICAVIDSCNGFDPRSAALAGVVLENLLWARCSGDLENAFTSADYLVQAKGFGMIWLNLCGLPKHKLKMVPRTYWYRYRTGIKETPTLFIVTGEEPVAGSASHETFEMSRKDTMWSGLGRYKLLREFHLDLHSRKHFFGRTSARIRFDYNDV